MEIIVKKQVQKLSQELEHSYLTRKELLTQHLSRWETYQEQLNEHNSVCNL